MVVPAGSGSETIKRKQYFRPGRPSTGSPVNIFPRIELGAPREVLVTTVSLCRDPCAGGPEDFWIEDGRADPQAGPPCIVARVRASVPPHL